jgi:hypothetical protein
MRFGKAAKKKIARPAADVVRKGSGKLSLDSGRRLPSLDRRGGAGGQGDWGLAGFWADVDINNTIRAELIRAGGEAKGIDGMLRSWVFIRLAQVLVDYPQDSSSRRNGYGTLVGWGTMESRITIVGEPVR